MMVETILESSQDFGMSNGALPQWKRELLQRRLARARPSPAPSPPPPPPPPPPPTVEEDEELRYGPGIVKRLKSRYLSLALRDAPRRRPSVLRRATSLEHLLDERPPPAPRVRPPRPSSLVAPSPALPHREPRRDLVKRARSVDALSRLESREDPPPPPSPEPPRPPAARAPRPPRRPRPLLREAERPPPDVVRSTLRKFESAPPRRAAPAARVSAVLRGLEPRRSLTPDASDATDAPRSPSPLAPATPPPPTSPPPPIPTESPPPSIAECPRSPSPVIPEPEPEPTPPSPSPRSPAPTTPEPTILPAQVATSTPALEPKIGPAPRVPPTPPTQEIPPLTPSEASSADEVESGGARRVSRAALEEIARAGSSVRYTFPAVRPTDHHLPPVSAINPVLAARGLRRVGVIRPMPAVRAPSPPLPAPAPTPAPTLAVKQVVVESPERAVQVNGHSTPEPSAVSRIGAAGIERAWSGTAVRRISPPRAPPPSAAPRAPAPRRGGRAPPPAATSVVFNFSDRKEVPDYIENDGIILRANRRIKIKAGEPGVVVLRPELLAGPDSDGEEESDAGGGVGGGGPPSPCDVRFVNDNVLINGKSSMPNKPNKDRIAKLKLQFDDSLTRTFEYPSETSMCEETPSLPPHHQAPPGGGGGGPPADAPASLADNTHIASAALSRYTPTKSCAAAFQLGLNPQRANTTPPAMNGSGDTVDVGSAVGEGGVDEEEGEVEVEVEGDARPCGADVAKSWSDARTHHTDLLF